MATTDAYAVFSMGMPQRRGIRRGLAAARAQDNCTTVPHTGMTAWRCRLHT